MIVHRLYELGHRRIAMLQDAGSGEPVPARRPGFVAACRELGIAEADRPQFTFGSDRRGEADVRLVDGPGELITALTGAGITALLVEQSADAGRIRAAAVTAGLTVPVTFRWSRWRRRR